MTSLEEDIFKLFDSNYNSNNKKGHFKKINITKIAKAIQKLEEEIK